MIKLNSRKILFLIIFISFASLLKAQDSSKLYFTTSVGLLLPVSSFSKSYGNSLALNSGIEYKINRHYFAQFVLDFNAVKYNQKIKDGNSSFLFQHTNSSVFLAGFNIGRNISITQSGSLFVSPYLGIGYANIGEPRLTVNNNTSIIEQNVSRMAGIFTRQGLRTAYNTKSRVLQTLYLDVSYWSANIKVQQSRPKALSFLVGTRFGF